MVAGICKAKSSFSVSLLKDLMLPTNPGLAQVCPPGAAFERLMKAVGQPRTGLMPRMWQGIPGSTLAVTSGDVLPVQTFHAESLTCLPCFCIQQGAVFFI